MKWSDSWPDPTPWSLETAESLVRIFKALGDSPHRTPSCDGGVALHLSTAERAVDVGVDNDGEVSVSSRSRTHKYGAQILCEIFKVSGEPEVVLHAVVAEAQRQLSWSAE